MVAIPEEFVVTVWVEAVVPPFVVASPPSEPVATVNLMDAPEIAVPVDVVSFVSKAEEANVLGPIIWRFPA